VAPAATPERGERDDRDEDGRDDHEGDAVHSRCCESVSDDVYGKKLN
jgi:hypothetical protein